MRVLIVEDDETFCQFLSEILEQTGAEVVASTHGLDGYKKAWSDRYDLFIFDVRMPGFLGTEIAEALKEKDPTAKVILISAFADETLRESASNLGAPLLSKPFSADTLLQAINDTASDPA